MEYLKFQTTTADGLRNSTSTWLMSEHILIFSATIRFDETEIIHNESKIYKLVEY